MKTENTEKLNNADNQECRLLNDLLFYDKLKSNYFGVYYVNLDTGEAQIIKTGHPNITGEAGLTVQYKTLLKNIAAVSAGDAVKYFKKISSTDYVKKSLMHEDYGYHSYKSYVFEGHRWVNVTSLVLKRHEDGTPSLFALCFNLLDEESCRHMEAQEKLKESMDVVGGLASEYTALYYVNLDTDEYVPYHIVQRIEDIRPYYAQNPKFTDLAHEFADSKLVRVEDRENLRDFYPSAAAVKEELRDIKSKTMLFKRNYGGESLWTEISIIKCEGEHEEAHNAVIGFTEKDREVRERAERLMEAEETERLIDNIAMQNHIVYVIDMADDSLELRKNENDMFGADVDFTSFTGLAEYTVNNIIHPRDRERMRAELDPGVIRLKLREKPIYGIECCVLSRGATRFGKITVSSIGGERIVMGFVDIDFEITEKYLERQRYTEFLALFTVDLDTGKIKSIKTSPLFRTADPGRAVPYGLAMQAFASSYEGEAREFFTRISDINYLKREFARDSKRTFSYKSAKLGEGKWIDVSSYCILRNYDGTPAVLTLGLSVADAYATARQEIQDRLRQDMHLIGGLANGYSTLYYVNIDDQIFRIHTLDGERYPETSTLVSAGGNPFILLQKFGHSELVHPDDRQLFDICTAEQFRERLAHTKRFTVRYRRAEDGDYVWYEMEVTKYEDINEPANALVIGFAERDAEIRSEQAVNSCFSILGKEIPPQESIDALMKTAGEFYGAERAYIFEFSKDRTIISNTCEWCADGVEPMKDHLQNVPSSEIAGWMSEFKRQGAFWMSTLDDEGSYGTPEGRALLEMQGIESLIAAPIMNGDDIAGFIGVDNPSKAGRNTEVLKSVAIVAYGEILKRKENDEEHITLSKLTEAFLSVYFTDISTDYMRTWKIAKEYEDAYGSVTSYSESMGEYVRLNIAERDRERCKEMTSPEYVLEQFRTKDRFSIDMTDIMLGYERNVVFDYIKVNEEGTRFVVCCRDVTEALAREKQYRAEVDLANQQRHIKAFGDMVNAALWSMLINDANEIVAVNWSDEERHMLGYSGEEEFPNTLEAWSSILHPDDWPRTIDHFSRAVNSRDTETSVYDVEYRLRRKSGEYCWYHTIGRMENAEDGMRRMYGIITDISANKKIEEQTIQLAEARDAAEAASKSKTSFLFNMSHDIRTPMNAITGFTSMAKKYADDPEKVRNYLEKIDVSGQQLLTLINQVLEMARIESGKIEFEERPINVIEEFNSMVTVLAEQAMVYGLDFHYGLSDIKHPHILADVARMGSITLNITGNAMKYTPSGGRIDYTLREIAPRKEGCATFVFTVQDTGIGMSKEFLKTLFEPFSREKNSTVSKIQGTGLGMSIVKNLIDLLGGTIEVESEPGKGTKFDVTVDFKLNTDAVVPAKAEEENEDVSFDGRRVLLVEDNDMNREIATDILEEHGFIVESANDGDIAVQMVRDIAERGDYGYYDFILMDIQMPRMNGYEATYAIRTIPAPPGVHIPIIAMTANAFEEDRQNSFAAGMDEHLAKPIDIQKLLKTLAKFI